MTRVPPLTLVRQFDTHRLVPSRHLRGGDSVFTRLTDDEDELQAIFALDAATNDRLMAEHQRFAGIGVEELVFGVPCSHVVNATFCHPHPLGARFNGPDRGAWYAAFALETSQAEVAFHKAVELAETAWTGEMSMTYDDYLADFSAEFHDLRRGAGFKACLDAKSYVASRVARRRLSERAPRRRHLHRVLSPAAGGQRAPRRDVSLHLERQLGAAHRAGALGGARRQARPRILAIHQRRPTKRKRQSWKNSGGLPSKAWPTNWKIQPTRNSASGTGQNPPTNSAITASGSDSTISGMPSVWQNRLTGC
jgi:hypothetical protein